VRRILIIRRFVIAGAVVATLAGTGLGTAAADPLKAPSLDTLTGVGTGNIAPLFDNGTNSQPLGDAAGSFVHDYNATEPTYPVASWDAENPETGFVEQMIATKAASSSDTSCDLQRPDDTSTGVYILNQDQTDLTLDSSGQLVYCVDYVRADFFPDLFYSTRDAFVALARDAMAWSYPKVKGETNPQPKSLTFEQLTGIFDCQYRNWDEVGGKNAPIGVVLPVDFSDTRQVWLLDELGITATVEPCWQNGDVTVNGTTDAIYEDTGLSAGNVAQFTTTQTIDGISIPAADDIFSYSIGGWIAQGTRTKRVGGHATSVWGHGNLTLGEIANIAGTPEAAVTKNSSGQPVINPKWNPRFLYILYAATRNGCWTSTEPDSLAVCLPSRTPPAGGIVYPTYEAKGLAALFGPKGWICKNATAQADIVSYGFTRIANCGALTGGD
jgi:hypothetical protein